MASTVPISYADLLAGDWYAGAAPSYAEGETNEALDALQAHWPERLESLAEGSARGPAVVAPIIHDGLIIARCRDVAGFSVVLDRWRGEERSAHAEASIGETFLNAGFEIEFDVPLQGKRLDLILNPSSAETFVEVKTPDTAQSVEEAHDLIKDVAERVVASSESIHTDVLLDPGFSIDRLPYLLEEITAVQALDTEVALADLAVILRREVTLPVTGPRLTRPSAARPISWAYHLHLVHGVITSATIGISISDERANKFLSRAIRQFSKDHANLLVLEVSAVAGGTKGWQDLLAPRLTPNQNSRVGAILLFNQNLSGSPLRARKSFTLVQNQHAVVPIPDETLAVLATIAGCETHLGYMDFVE